VEHPDDLAFQARLLAAALDIDDVPVREAIPPEVVTLARDGQTIEAIRRLRKLRGFGLIQAKRVVDAITAQD
jgi:ribosomal protein L7/L12